MRLNVREYDNHQTLLLPQCIGDYLPKDHLSHVVDEVVNEINLSVIYKKISSVGNPAYHPALMVKILFYGYATKTYSSRRIEEKLNTDIAFIYLSGMQKPDFRTISDFRKNNLKEIKGLFVKIVQICHRLGMTKLGEISIDSKVMKANASADRTYDEERIKKEQETIEKVIKEYLEKANQVDNKEDEIYGSDKRGNELGEDITNKEKRIKKMRVIIEQLKEAQEKIRETNKEKINLTDEDAEFQKDKTRIIPGYRAHIAVDSRRQVVITSDVTNQANDTSQLVSMIDKTIGNIEEIESERFSKKGQEVEKINIIADAGYSSGKNLAELEKDEYRNKVEAYIPDLSDMNKKGSRGSHKDTEFNKSKFVYNSIEDKVICPAGKGLHHIMRYNHRGVMYDTYGNTKECKSCVNYGICTKSERGRHISISEHQYLVDKMREKLTTEEGKKIYSIRKITAEPVLGNLSQNLGFREFLLRGLEKVKGEFSLMCSAHNLLKISKFLRQLGKDFNEAIRVKELVLVPDT